MSIVAGIVAGGHTVSEAFGVLDARQQDAWSRIIIDERDFTHGLRFGKDIEEIENYTHKTRTVK